MTLTNLCNLFDSYYIANHKSDLTRRYMSSSDLIFTDGEYKHHVNKDGYVVIKDVENANYFIYIDEAGNLCLWIYELTPETLYKEIINGMNKIREQTGMHKHSTTPSNKEPKQIDAIIEPQNVSKNEDINIKNAPAEVVNINTFECLECGSREFAKARSGNVITMACNKCKTKFKLIPSKYYIIKSKTTYTDLTLNGINEYMEEVEEDAANQD